MRLLSFLEKECPDSSYQQLFLMAGISGVANGLLLAIVNHATHVIAENEDVTQYFLMYMITFVLFIYTQWFAFDRAITIIESALYNVRTRLSQKVKNVELSFIEKIGADHLYSRLTQNDTFVSQAIPQLTATAQMSILMIFSLLYLAYLSPITFALALITMVIGVVMFQVQSRSIRKALATAKDQEKDYFNSISGMIKGFKEIKMNEQKADDIIHDIASVSKDSRDLKIFAGRKEARMWGFGRVFVYILLPILVFIVPTLSDEHLSVIFKVTSTMLFITGPITILVNMIPIINRLNMALSSMQDLEAEMDEAGAAAAHRDEAPYKDFQRITINDIQFRYPNSNGNGFAAGPFREQIDKGELIFIIGGNGSGKSTFLKLFTGLYQPVSGHIQVDQHLVTKDHSPAYRELYSIVFTDFHLFDKLYGIPNLDAEQVNYWLKKMRMEHKVQFKDGAFTSTSLSTGQRKRLAFIAAMLEEKPILVIDEFAADQDPQFREYFYETLLLEIKATGKTVIAVTHDDHYFHVADRVLKMEEGQLVPYDGTH